MTDPAPEIEFPFDPDIVVGEVGHVAHHNKLAYVANQLAAGVFDVVVNVKNAPFNAIGDRNADDTAAIQAAINSVRPTAWNTITPPKGGIVFLPPGTYRLTSPLSLPSYVRLMGAGALATELFISNGANCDAIKTEGYDTFVGTGLSYYDTSGVPYAFGIENLSVSGNRFNNTSGGGIKIYGRGYAVNDVRILQAAGAAFTSRCETGNDTYVRNKTKLGEATVTNLHIRDCEGSGMFWYGPTDAKVDGVYIGECRGTYGAYIESSIDVGLLHVYACGNETTGAGYGTAIKGNSRFENLITEHNFSEGLLVDSYYVQISNLQMYRNARVSKVWNMRVTATAQYLQIGTLELKLDDTDAGGLSLLAPYMKIGSCVVVGNDSAVTYTKTGIHCGSTFHNSSIRDLHVERVGLGLALHQGGSTYGNTIGGVVRDCTVGFSPGSQSTGGNTLDLKVNLTGTQTAVSFNPTAHTTDQVAVRVRSAAGAWSTLLQT